MERKKILINLFISVVIALISGILGFFLVYGFVSLKVIISKLLVSYNSFKPMWALIGAFLVGSIIYRIEIGASGEGIPSYIRILTSKDKKFFFSETFFKFWAALITISTFGVGGIVGPLGRTSAGIVSRGLLLFKNVKIPRKYYRSASICGMAAVIGTIFNSSIGGGIFAVEILRKDNIDYQDLFPAILGSSMAVYIAEIMEFTPFYQFSAKLLKMTPKHILLVIIVAFVAGAGGKFFTIFYYQISKLFHRDENKKILIKVLLGTFLGSTIAYFIHKDLLGTSIEIFDALFSGDLDIFHKGLQFGPLFLTIFFYGIIKIITNSITIASGMSAGFTGPAALAGLLIGAAFTQLFGIEPLTGSYFSLLAAGFSSLLASSMNVPLAASIITIESFGLSYGLPAGLSAIIGYSMNRQGTLYVYARRKDKLKKRPRNESNA